jgi:hypothetical protein
MLVLISGSATCPKCVRVVNFNTRLDVVDTLGMAIRKFKSSHRYCRMCSKFGMKIEVDFVLRVDSEMQSAVTRKVPFTVTGFDPASGKRVLCVEVAAEIARPAVDDTVTDNNDQHWLVLGVHNASTPLDWRVDVRRVPASYKWR